MTGLPQRIADVFAQAHAFGPEDWDRVAELYAGDMEFSDPIQTIRGRDRFLKMNKKLSARLEVFRFDDVRAAGDEPHFFVSWTMTLKFPHLPAMRCRGATEIETAGGKIVRHVDHWDLVGTLMSVVPIAGPVYRRVVRMLG